MGSHGPQHATEQDRRMLAKAIFRLFDQWQLSQLDQLNLLGLTAHELETLVSMRNSHMLIESDALAERTRSLLRIYRYLSMLYPEHLPLRQKWMMSSHPRLNGEAPMERIKRGGAAEIRFVTTLLEEQLF